MCFFFFSRLEDCHKKDQVTLTDDAFRAYAEAENGPYHFPEMMKVVRRSVHSGNIICFGPWSMTDDFFQVDHIENDPTCGNMTVHYMDQTMYEWHTSHLLNMVFLACTDTGNFEVFTFVPVAGNLAMKAVEIQEPRVGDKSFTRELSLVPSALGFAASRFVEFNVPLLVQGVPSQLSLPEGTGDEADGSDDTDEEYAATPPLKRKYGFCDEETRSQPSHQESGRVSIDIESDSSLLDTPPLSPKRVCVEDKAPCSYIN